MRTGGIFKLIIIMFLIIVIGKQLLGGSGASHLGSSNSSNGNVSMAVTHGGSVPNPTAGQGVVHHASPAAYPPLPGYDPKVPPHSGLIGFAYETPAYNDTQDLEQVGNGVMPSIGNIRYRPLRAGEMTLFDGDTNVSFERPKSFIYRGALLVTDSGTIRVALRFYHPYTTSDVRCYGGILANGKSYAADLHEWERHTPSGTSETIATFTDVQPGAIDIAFAFSCASKDDDVKLLRQITIDPIEYTGLNATPIMLRESNFIFPGSVN